MKSFSQNVSMKLKAIQLNCNLLNERIYFYRQILREWDIILSKPSNRKVLFFLQNSQQMQQNKAFRVTLAKKST